MTNRPTNQPTDGRTDKASYRVACPQLKTEREIEANKQTTKNKQYRIRLIMWVFHFISRNYTFFNACVNMGVFLVATTNAFNPVERIFSMNKFS